MSRKTTRFRLGELKTDVAIAKNLEVSLGRISDETWTEPVAPTPEHIFNTAETKEEAIVMIAKLCMRPNDTAKGRAMKLTNYIDLHKRFYGIMPDDLHLFVRNKADLPITMKREIIKIIEEKSWKERRMLDPTFLPRLTRKGK